MASTGNNQTYRETRGRTLLALAQEYVGLQGNEGCEVTREELETLTDYYNAVLRGSGVRIDIEQNSTQNSIDFCDKGALTRAVQRMEDECLWKTQHLLDSHPDTTNAAKDESTATETAAPTADSENSAAT